MVTTVPKGSGGKITASFPTNDQAHAAIIMHSAISSLVCKNQASNHPINTGFYAIVNHSLHSMPIATLLLVTTGNDGNGAAKVNTFAATTYNAAAMPKIV